MQRQFEDARSRPRRKQDEILMVADLEKVGAGLRVFGDPDLDRPALTGLDEVDVQH
jgi:hypothetical protein